MATKTNFRWVVAILIFIIYTIAAADRANIGVVLPFLKKEFHLTNTEAGGINVSADKNVDYTPCDIETLYAYNPEVYVVLSHSRNDTRSFITGSNLADIAAVKTNQVFSITDDLLQRPGPRSFTGLVKLAEILHPQEMKDWETK